VLPACGRDDVFSLHRSSVRELFSSFFFAFHLPDVNVTCTLFSVQRNASRCECDNLRPLHPGARSLSLGRVTAVEVFFVFGGRESSTRGSFDSVLTPAAAPSFE
jgi:hypothetical protein